MPNEGWLSRQLRVKAQLREGKSERRGIHKLWRKLCSNVAVGLIMFYFKVQEDETDRKSCCLNHL